VTRIVAGVDGSPNSARALRRAVEEAALRDGSVEAVYAFPAPHRSVADELVRMPIGLGGPLSGGVSPGHDEVRAAQDRADSHLDHFIHQALEGVEGPRPEPVAVPSDHPAETLIDQSRGADLLVIGTRGHGGFTGMLLGSVAHQAIQHAKCPVLILPPEDE
jgi:nucleotide-binding universal stress UspA family protein